MKYLVPIDFNQNEAQNIVIQNLGSDPGSPLEGQIWYNTTSHALKARGNGLTKDLFAAGGGTVTSVDQTFTGGLISVSGNPITGSGTLALTVAGTSGGIPYFSGAASWASSAALAANALMIGGGAGAAPSTVTTGTGVITALGVAVGAAGAFVVNGGAMGTPSSGTVTNLTGTASININGTVGATTKNTGAFTTITGTSSATLGTNGGTGGSLVLMGSTSGSGTISVSATGVVALPSGTTMTAPVLGTPASGDFSTGVFTWPTFNQNTSGSAATLTTGRTIAMTGDVAWTSPSFNGSGNVTAAGTLATVNSNIGSFGDASNYASITVNGKGLITAVSQTAWPTFNQNTTGTASNLSGTPTLPNGVTATTQAAGDNTNKLATTSFVQTAVLQAPLKEAAKYGTTTALPASTYANGTAGVGATLTENANGALSVDGSTPAVNDRILVKNQATTFQNGLYAVTAVGSGAAPFVLTRVSDLDQTADIKTGAAVFVTAGATLASTTWDVNSATSPVLGTDAITFAQSAGPGSVTSGNGITVTGASVAIDTTVTVDKTTAQALTNKDLSSGTNTFPASLVTTTTLNNASLAISGTTIAGTSSATLGTNGGTGGSVVLRGSTSGTATISVSAAGVLALPSTATGITATTVGLSAVTNDAQTKAAIVPNTAPSTGQLLVGNAGGTAYAPVSVSGSGATISLASTGVVTISAIANASLTNSTITIAGTSTALGGSITLDTLSGVSSNGFLKRTSANTWTNDSTVTRKYSATIGNGALTTITITQATHGLAADGTNIAMVYDATSGAQVYPNVSVIPASGNVQFDFTVAPTTNQYRVVIIG